MEPRGGPPDDTPSEVSSQDPATTALILGHLAKVEAVARILCQKLPPRFEWRELAQVGVLAMVEAASLYDPVKGSFWTYVYLGVRGAMLDFLNDSRETERCETVRFVAPWSCATLADVRITVRIDLERAVAKLTLQERQVLQHISQGESGREIARLLGISEARVSQVRRRARQRLRAA